MSNDHGEQPSVRFLEQKVVRLGSKIGQNSSLTTLREGFGGGGRGRKGWKGDERVDREKVGTEKLGGAKKFGGEKKNLTCCTGATRINSGLLAAFSKFREKILEV